MISIRYKNTNLDLAGPVRLSMTIKSSLFFLDGGDIIPGSYSFPFDLALTDKNKSVLNFPDRLDVPGRLLTEQLVSVYYDGVHLFLADLYIKKVNETTAEAFLIIGEFAKIEDQLLNEVDYGGPVSMGATVADALAYAKDTAVNPNSYDHIFFPVSNLSYFPLDEGPTNFGVIQNLYDDATQKFVSSSDNQAAMPFLKLSFILEKIFADHGYNLDNQFQTVDELRSICIYNTFSIYEDADNWATSFDPKNHVPDVQTKSFVKEIMKTWGLFLSYNLFSKKATLKPCKDVLTESPEKNWTSYVQRKYERRDAENPVYQFCFEFDPNDQANNLITYRTLIDPDDILAEAEVKEDIAAPVTDGLYYIWSTDSVLRYDGAAWWLVQTGRPCVKGAEGSETITVNAQPINNYIALYPIVKMLGKSTHLEFSYDQTHIRWTTYRGFQALDGKSYPYANATPYNSETKGRIGSHAMHWAGPYGIYEQYWKGWREILTDSKEVNMTFFLPLTEIITFDPAKKVRIGNQNYFVKELNPVFSTGKYIKTQATLLTSL